MNKVDLFLAISKGEIEAEKLDQSIKDLTDNLNEQKLESLFNEFRAFVLSDFYSLSFKGNKMPEHRRKNIEAFFDRINSYSPNHELISHADKIKYTSIYKTLKKVNDGEYSNLERLELIETLTGYDNDKLKALKNDISNFISYESKPYTENISKDVIRKIIETYESKNVEPPLLLKILDVKDMKWRDRTESEKLDFESGKHKKEDFFDIKEALYRNAFTNIDFFKYQVDELINEIESKNDIKSIHWQNGDESLKQFINSIKNAGLIENRNTDDLIQEHFKQTDSDRDVEPLPIRWQETNRLIIYMFNKLSEACLIDTMDRQFKLITEHFLDKHGKPFKRDSIKQDSTNMKNFSPKPRGSELVDSIIKSLSD